jgi:hypothetical protein
MYTGAGKGETIAYRAGGWNLDPEPEYIKVLKEIGVKIDSSGFKGGMMSVDRHTFDYSGLFSNQGYWPTPENTIQKKGNGGLMEIPIYSLNFDPFRKFMILNRMRERMKSITYTASSGKKDLSTVLREMYFLFRSWIKWDMCKLNAKEMMMFLNKAKDDGIVPLVMIGHTKDFVLPDEFNEFLKKASGSHEFMTFKEIHSIIKDSE